MRILHLTADYPDPLAPAKTRAVSNLLALARGHEHRVYSINRVGWRAGVEALDFGDAAGADHRALAYGAPPGGLFLRRFLSRLADWIGNDIDRRGFRPDLVHAHKLSVEGLAGAALAERLGVPLAVSVQGNSDLKIVGAKRDIRADYARVWHRAALVFPFAPWAAAGLGALLGRREGAVHLLPCPTGADSLVAPRESGPVIRTAFHFAGVRHKNAEALIVAAGRAARDAPDLRLEIIGGGDARVFARLAALARSAAPGRVRFLGTIPNANMQELFTSACGFALVSRRESYGMVFAEALLAGAPCLIPRGRAIDGYFEDGSVVIAADPGDGAAIVDGLVRLVREQPALKRRLAELGARGGLEFLRRDTIAQTYLGAIAGLPSATASQPVRQESR